MHPTGASHAVRRRRLALIGPGPCWYWRADLAGERTQRSRFPSLPHRESRHRVETAVGAAGGERLSGGFGQVNGKNGGRWGTRRCQREGPVPVGSPQNRLQVSAVGKGVGNSPPHASGMNLYAALEAEWTALAATAQAAQHLARWCAREPALAGPATPATLVAEVVADRRWRRADPRLAALVRLAADDLAARAVLQCVLPGLRAEPMRCRRHHWSLADPVDDLDDVTTELAGAAWEVIRARAGITLADPENTIVRAAAEKLRTRRRAEARTRARIIPLAGMAESGQVGVHDARSIAERVMVALVDAVRAETVTARQADLLYNVRVARLSGREAGRRYGMTPGQVFHAVGVAETALQRASA